LRRRIRDADNCCSTVSPLNTVVRSYCVFFDVLLVYALIARRVLRKAALTLVHHRPILFDEVVFMMILG
jgi:hypothetical protein